MHVSFIYKLAHWYFTTFMFAESCIIISQKFSSMLTEAIWPMSMGHMKGAWLH